MQKQERVLYREISRKEYIAAATQIIREEGIEAISIRKLASRLNYSSASLYRYFENLEELLFYAQIGELTDYIVALSEAEEHWKDAWDMHFGVWRAYAKEAFRHPRAFESVFYKKMDLPLRDALKEYYEMFPESLIKLSPTIKTMLSVPGYYERDFFMCQNLVKEGKLHAEHAERFSHIITNLFLGYFKYVEETGIEEEGIEEKVNCFLEEAMDIARLYAIVPPSKAASE